MTPVRITRTSTLDAELFDSITAIWNATGVSNPARADSFEAIQYNLDNGGMLLLACIDEVLAGVVWLSHDFRRLYIHHMAVAPEQQNKGIGRQLLLEAVSIARVKGYQAKLEVHNTNDAARHLYASCGFSDLDGYITMIKRG